MTTKRIQRNIPPERENVNDRFRVKYNNKNDFDNLEVSIVRLVDGEQKLFVFDSADLPNSDSIYFTTSVMNNIFQVNWRNIFPSGGSKNPIGERKISKKAKSEVSIGKTTFPPISNENSKILILGTMPGERSLALQQYYGHSGNQFWKLIYALFDKPFNIDYEDKKNLLLENGIALWDVLEYCEGDGSLDSNIVNEKANNFDSFYGSHPEIKEVFFTSKLTSEYYDTYVKRKSHLGYHSLPSPSKMNTWKNFEEKLYDWKLILKFL